MPFSNILGRIPIINTKILLNNVLGRNAEAVANRAVNRAINNGSFTQSIRKLFNRVNKKAPGGPAVPVSPTPPIKDVAPQYRIDPMEHLSGKDSFIQTLKEFVRPGAYKDVIKMYPETVRYRLNKMIKEPSLGNVGAGLYEVGFPLWYTSGLLADSPDKDTQGVLQRAGRLGMGTVSGLAFGNHFWKGKARGAIPATIIGYPLMEAFGGQVGKGLDKLLGTTPSRQKVQNRFQDRVINQAAQLAREQGISHHGAIRAALDSTLQANPRYMDYF